MPIIHGLVVGIDLSSKLLLVARMVNISRPVKVSDTLSKITLTAAPVSVMEYKNIGEAMQSIMSSL